jgi:hypothetical protein
VIMMTDGLLGTEEKTGAQDVESRRMRGYGAGMMKRQLHR